MSKNYEAAWKIIESLDDISASLSDMLDDEKDRHARPHIKAAIDHIEAAVEELENVDPDKEKGGDDYPSGTIMSKALGHSNSYITHITSGRVNPSVPELLYIIDYLGVSPKTFFTEDDENKARSILLQKAIDRLDRYSEEDLAMILPVLDRLR